MEEKVTREVAEQEVNAWLDYKKLSPKRREEKKEAIESLINFIQEGKISINSESFEITQYLLFEVGTNKLKEIKWKPFGNLGKFQMHMRGVESADFNGNAVAIACAQTGLSKNIISAFDSEDIQVLKFIAIFFL